MALTLAESAKLSLDMLQRGVIETIIEDSPMALRMPFIEVEGNSFKYNQEATLTAASFFAVNATWTEGTATFTQKTSNIAILGGDADVDNFIQRMRSTINDQRAIQTQLRAKSVARKWEDTIINGDTGVDANSFDGLKLITPAGQTITAGANGAALTLAMLDQGIDLIKGGKPDIILMSKRSRRKLKSLLQASTHYIESGADQFGRQVLMYDGIPVEVSDFQLDTEVQGTENAASSIYFIHFSEADGLAGLQNGAIEAIDVGQLESKDGTRVRLRWYVGMALLRDSAVSRIKGINAS